ncbi:hypothetical protein Nmel_003639 [Mimus melanotis]
MRLGTATLRDSACWEAQWRGTGNRIGMALSRPGTGSGTGIGCASVIKSPATAGTGARLCVGGISAGVGLGPALAVCTGPGDCTVGTKARASTSP